MNILLLNTYTHGGAGVACRRLQAALKEAGEITNLLTMDQVSPRWPFYAERLSFLPYERDKSIRFSFSLANFGHDLSRHKLVQAADVIHLHWVNQGFLSLKNIRQLAALGKPMVWTLHDMWAFTGGCHYSGDCTHFTQVCCFCPYLRSPGPEDLAQRIWQRKRVLYPPDIQFVTCSDWLAGVARSSGLLKTYPIVSIPNPIDTGLFQPASAHNRAEFRQGKKIAQDAVLVLFAAMKVGEKRKGFHYLLDALHKLKKAYPDLPVELLVLGQAGPEELSALPYPFHALGLVRDVSQLISIYGAADVFVIPSLEDNLPNTVMESLACGTPVVGFNTGGIPEMVGHLEEGFIADQHDAEALANGIYWATRGGTSVNHLRKAARDKVERLYSNKIVGRQYLRLYQDLLAKR